MREIKFESRVLISLRDKTTPYHDDMFGEDVWVSLGEKPIYINSYDYREFNGVPIGEMAKFLDKWNDKQTLFALDAMVALKKLRENKELLK